MLRHHPHVIDYSNCFLTPNFLAVTGEYANMGTLNNFLKRYSLAKICLQRKTHCSTGAAFVSATAARFLFQQLVMVVDYCHSLKESIAGGLNPDNVVICWNGSAPQAKIAATGQSGILSPAASPICPAFAFKAPETILERSSNPLSADMFSLAALLFYVVTGSLPFPVAPGESETAWAARVEKSEVVIPSHAANCDDLHGLLRGMLAPHEFRWSLADVKMHPFFFTNLPEGALKLSETVASADAGSGEDKQRMCRSLQNLLSCCGEQAQTGALTQVEAAGGSGRWKRQVEAAAYGPGREALHAGVCSSRAPSMPPAATSSGYMTVVSKELSRHLGGASLTV